MLKVIILILCVFQGQAYSAQLKGSDAVIIDAIEKQMQFNDLSQAAIKAMRTRSRKTSLEEFNKLNRRVDVLASEMSDDVFYCKANFDFNKSSRKSANVFRIRVKANTEEEAKSTVKDNCEQFIKNPSFKISNGAWSCLNIQNKTTSCINPTKLTKKSIHKWKLTY